MEKYDMEKYDIRERALIPIMVLTVVIAAVFICFSIFSILRNRDSMLNEVRLKAGSQAELLGENAASTFFDVDLILLTLRTSVSFHHDTPETLSAALNVLVKNQLSFIPQITGIYYFDENRKRVFASGETTEKAEISDEKLLTGFSKHRDSWLELYIGELNGDDGEKNILFSRRVESMEGTFLGTVIAVIDPVFFSRNYEEYLQIDVTAIGLFGSGAATAMAGWSNSSGQAGRFLGNPLSDNTLFAPFRAAIASGGGSRINENKTTICASYQLSGFPFQVVILHDKKRMLQKWLRDTSRELIISALTLVLALGAGVIALVHHRKRKKAEQALLDHQLALEDTVAQRTMELSEQNRILEQKNEELIQAAKKIQTLHGMLPICSYCKKIRDDAGYWSQIESYIGEHTGAEFSHGICPDCVQKYFPDLEVL